MRRLILALLLTCPMLANAGDNPTPIMSNGMGLSMPGLHLPVPSSAPTQTDYMLQQSTQAMQDVLEQSRRDQAQRDYNNTPTNFQPSLGVYPDSYYYFINGEIVRTDKNPQRFIALVKSGQHRVLTRIPLPPGYYLVNPEQFEMYSEQLEKEQRGTRGVMDKLKDLF